MGRIALFLAVVGGLAYVVIDAAARRLTGEASSPVLAISLSVIVAVILWTVFVWFAGDRLGQGGDDRSSKQDDR
jgi:uncharacterized membrane protein YdcZ (DUF606 family)